AEGMIVRARSQGRDGGSYKKMSEAESSPKAESTSNQTPAVVGIGASAGGLSALKIFLNHVPSDSGMAFVVVVHLAPDHESHLAELLQPHVPFPVQQVNDTTL